MEGLLLLVLCLSGIWAGAGDTNPQDAAALLSLMGQWKNTPLSWRQPNDPCGLPWDGIVCSKSRVTALKLSTMSISGTLSGDISQLTMLQSIDLSYNTGLGGPVTPNIGNLKQLSILILAGCSFTGSIPTEIGNLPLLSFLALNSNKFTGSVPASLGNLKNLYWFDVGDNQLSGPLPISSSTSPGLDLLVNTKHFHFNKNQLSGPIPDKLFSSKMTLIHILFDGNNFTGRIPSSVGLVQSLEALRLDRNSLVGPVPSSITNLSSLTELNLANNKLSGPLPDLTGMNNLNYVDLSNNTFTSSEAPAWFSTLTSLTALMIQNGELHGQVPQQMFGFQQLQQVILPNNAFNGTLDLGISIGPQLQLVNLQNNDIVSYKISNNYNNILDLLGNPVCSGQMLNTVYCYEQQQQTPYSTSLTKCGSKSCPSDGSLSPQSCDCGYPYTGVIIFRAPSFRDVTNKTVFQQLETSLWTTLGLTPGSVLIQDPFFDAENYLEIQVKLFPSNGMYFVHSEVLTIGFGLSNQIFTPPLAFGPYFFIASPYIFEDYNGKKTSLGTGAIAGVAVGCILLILGLVALGLYAFSQKRRAEKAVELSKPFASWGAGAKDSGDAPQLKGAKWFSFDELKKSTNGFSESTEIGSGGYGKVYKGIFPSGQLVAIKRAQQGSMQGGLEFKTEIELLSRVHHKNLVDLVGFCFEHGEQMLVYEYIPNKTLRESLSGKSGIQLDWNRRLKVSLGSAKGLAYLHELADPPIIHRDVKSTNILLDQNLNAKVADFGLSKLVADAEKGHVSTQVKGTLGYLDPEYYMTQQLTSKSDVYSFGVVMLELITARLPIEKGKYIVREVRLVMNRSDENYYGLGQLLDPNLRSSNALTGFSKFVDLAMKCVEESASDRPSMNDVVKEIEILLQGAGMADSESSSATEFGNGSGNKTHPYSDQPLKEDSLEYSGGFSYAT